MTYVLIHKEIKRKQPVHRKKIKTSRIKRSSGGSSENDTPHDDVIVVVVACSSKWVYLFLYKICFFDTICQLKHNIFDTSNKALYYRNEFCASRINSAIHSITFKTYQCLFFKTLWWKPFKQKTTDSFNLFMVI